MSLFGKQTAKPKWIRDQERKERKRKWWEIREPKGGVDRASQYESSLERENAGLGALGSILFGALIFGIMVGIVLLLNWIGKNFI